MRQWIGAGFLVVAFAFLIQYFGLIDKGKAVVSIAIESLGTIASNKLSEEEKEFQLQQNSKKLFGLFFVLAAGGILALLLPIAILWLCDKIGWLSLNAVIDTTISPLFILISSLVLILVLFLPGRLRSKPKADINRYSSLDQTLHQIAFKTYPAQVGLANLEDKLLAKDLAGLSSDNPIFITALPRAGTTLLLECFADLPEFATHCYRDMPFVLIPYLWNRYSRTFQREVESQERAHGDGMKINPDSPEALEEVIWTTFWPKHFQQDRIIPWDDERNEDFEKFFRSHIKKIILLRRKSNAANVRYVSKNNANIARIPLLKTLFPSSIIIVPFRDPLHHVASLLQQHLNFLAIHQSDPFAAEYMKAIGHFDFGQNLCPIDLGGWFDQRQSKSANSISFWLEYWVNSYQYLLTNSGKTLNFLNYDALCQTPEEGLSTIARIVNSRDPKAFVGKASTIGSPRPKQIDTSALSQSLLDRVNEVYSQLKALSLN